MNVLVEALLLALLHLELQLVLVLIALHLLEVAVHNFLVEVFSFGHFGLVPLKGLLPGNVLGRGLVLNHSRVLMWGHIATVMQGFDIASQERSVPDEAVLPEIDMAVGDGING